MAIHISIKQICEVEGLARQQKLCKDHLDQISCNRLVSRPYKSVKVEQKVTCAFQLLIICTYILDSQSHRQHLIG